MMLELTRGSDALMVPILLAVVEATVLVRILGAPSIYSARLGARQEPVDPERSLLDDRQPLCSAG
jgi:H+/Cl- antiporter ClcA